MKRVIAILIVPLILLPIGAVALAADGPRGVPGQDYALGGGRTETDLFDIAAHSGKFGQNAYGQLSAKAVPGTTPFQFDGRVTCLRVVGNLATLGGEILFFRAKGYPDPEIYHSFLFFVADNGSDPANPDVISYQFVFEEPPSDTCPDPDPAQLIFPLLKGNIVVHDE